ncbi:hypothetical protein JKF63_01880 [Porcisia hertigi]|uniref:Transmembrane protein n=1 Tax=Porcisia hertigi TaxID=2761500 RepID=A0A836L0H6_9TRYP|nr:hypothetical protein JKF63_01880 [Porcisia hertigi]
MVFVRGKGSAQRPPVGVLPYRVPPLSGLYRMRYYPPTTAAATSSDHLSVERGGTAGDAITGAVSASGANSSAVRHAAVHEQLLRASSLGDGEVDLFALYSVCEVEAVPCMRCALHTQTTLKTCSYRLCQSYHLRKGDADSLPQESTVGPGTTNEVHTRSAFGSSPLMRNLQEGWYVFFFPISECGRLKDNLLVTIGDVLIPGDVAECDLANDGCLQPLKTSVTAAASAPKSTSGTSRRWKPLFYYVVSPVPVHWDERDSADVHLTTSWRSSPTADPEHRQSKKRFTLLYSYYCSPRAPDIFTCRAQFPGDTPLQLVSSPNCDTGVQLRTDVTKHTAMVRVETVDGNSLETHRNTRDYTFALHFFFGDDLESLNETSMFAAAVVAIVFLLLLWLFLTRDLIL